MNSSTLKTLFLWMAIFLMVVFLWKTFQTNTGRTQEITYSEFSEQVRQGEIAKVTIRGKEVEGEYAEGASRDDRADGFRFQLPFEADSAFVDELQKADVDVTADEAKDNLLGMLLFNFGPILLIVALWIFFMRQMQSGGNKAMSFGKSKAKLLNATGKKVTFQDVAGVEEAKDELSEIVDFLKEPQKFQRLGGRIPKGVLLMGPPGTGKTLLARAIAGEANVPFFSISGSDFVEMFVGVGASRVRDLFEQGKKNAPCIIFIDEIDAVGRHRGAGLGGGHDEREQTLNQLLVEMDGFETSEGVILIAATNRPDVLDPALLRPGRFDRRVIVDRPDINGRLGILRVHTRDIPLSDDVDLGVIARGTPGFAGADLANLVNEAALIAARRNKKSVEMADFEFAKDKVLMGVERKTMMLTEDERLVTAYHEAGHALVAAFVETADPLHKVTIIPRGRALGVTMQLPTEDKYTYKKRFVESRLAILMGGRVAEELTQDDITTGAGNDIEQATDLARRMVCEWGMSELGPLAFGSKDEPVFIGREMSTRSDYSDETAVRIDQETSRFVREAYETATGILTSHREVLDELARRLLEHETMDGREVYELIHEMTGLDRFPILPVHPIESEAADEEDNAEAADGSDSEAEIVPRVPSGPPSAAPSAGDEGPGGEGESAEESEKPAEAVGAHSERDELAPSEDPR